MVDALFKDVPVLPVGGAAVRYGRHRAGPLTEDIGPARLVAARHSDPETSLGQVVEDRGFLGDADRILGRHDIAERSDIGVLDQRRPARVQNARIGTDFVAFRMQVMLDGRDTPNTHCIGLADHLVPFVHDFMVELGVGAQCAARFPAFLAFRGEHRIELQNNFR